MSIKKEPNINHSFWSSIIQSVKTPLGFFALIALIAEAIFGTIALYIERPEKTYLIISMIILFFVLVILVAILAAYRPEALSGKRPNKVLPSNDELKIDSSSKIETIAKDLCVDPSLVDPKLVRFDTTLNPIQFRILNLPRPEKLPFYNWTYSPTGTIPFYEIPFFLLPVTDQIGNPKGHLVINVQPSQTNDPITQIIEARVKKAIFAHFLISSGHAWRMHEGIQFLNRRIGYLRFKFEDGSKQRTDLVLGKHLREWAFGNNTNLVTEFDQKLVKPAWLSHNSTNRFDLLSIELINSPKNLELIEIVAQFEDDHPGKIISTPAIIVSAITIERQV